MRITILTLICILILLQGYGQDVNSIYLKGVEKLEAGEYKEAIDLFSKTIKKQPENAYAWYNRGVSESKLSLFEESISDFDQSIKLFPDYKKAYLNRGISKLNINDKIGAKFDFNFAIKLDSNYAIAYYNRGIVYESLNKKDSACMDFNKAKQKGLENAQKKIDKCNDTSKTTFPKIILTKTADNDKYGYTQDYPIKVGGGPANQRAYLNMLIDAQGKSIKYKRIGSCCPYKSSSKVAVLGYAMIDKYEITYFNEKGKEKKTIVYISFYDYEAPMIIMGFKSIESK